MVVDSGRQLRCEKAPKSLPISKLPSQLLALSCLVYYMCTMFPQELVSYSPDRQANSTNPVQANIELEHALPASIMQEFMRGHL